MSVPIDEGHAAWDEMAAGYALRALEPDDEATFVAHLSGCSRCEATVAEMSETAARLACSAPDAAPSPDLRARLRAATSHEPEIVVLADRRFGRRTQVLAAAASAAVLLAAGVAIGNVTSDGRHSANQLALTQCVEDALCQHFPLADSRGHVVGSVLVRDGKLWVLSDGLPHNNTSSQIYVLWQILDNGQPMAVQAFDVHGTATTVVNGARIPDASARTSGYAVSREPGRSIPAKPSTTVATTKL